MFFNDREYFDFTCECEVDDEEVHARLAALVVAEKGGQHGRVSHHDQRQQRPQQRELLRLRTNATSNA